MDIVTLFVSVIVGLLVSMLLFYRFVFLRDPERVTPPNAQLVSPADGIVIKILKVHTTEKSNDALTLPKGLFGKIKTFTQDVSDSCYVISIMMNVYHVHVQRSPTPGKVLDISYQNGLFLNAVYGAKKMEWLRNENQSFLIERPDGSRMKIIQIAGFLCRRIVSYVQKGDSLTQGQRLGMIKMGSQVTLIIPSKGKLHVKEGDSVFAGETLIQ